MNTIRLPLSNFMLEIFLESQQNFNWIKMLFPVSADREPPVIRKLSVYRDSIDGFVLNGGALSAQSFNSQQELAGALLFEIGEAICTEIRDNEYIFHAAAVELDDQLLLLSGLPGSGKSTLAYTLSEYGFFVGDEYAHIDVFTGEVWSDYFPLQLKKGNPFLQCFGKSEMVEAVDPYSGLEGFYISADSINKGLCTSDCRSKYKKAIICFPHYDSDYGKPVVSPVRIEMLPGLLLSGLIGKEPRHIMLQRMIKMLASNRFRLFEISFSDAKEAAACLCEHVNDRKLLQNINNWIEYKKG